MIQQRNTQQKQQVYAALCELANHPTAEAVYGRVVAAQPSISRATVYRILNNMARDGKIKRVAVPNGADHFDHQTHPHYHLKCSVCGGVYDLDMPVLPDLEVYAAQSDTGVEIEDHIVLFYGKCKNCKSYAQY